MASILAIDDDPDMRALLQQALGSAGHTVALAADGREAVEQYSAQPTDLVILDIFMPNQEGLETITELRTRFPGVKILAMSGHATATPMLSVAKKLGAIDFIQKPFITAELLALVGKTLSVESRPT
jgi:DNA-binding NtrC family response regulator